MANGWGGPNPKMSGQDPRGRLQNQGGYQQQRFENQQGPAVSEFARQFGRAAETQYDDYGDIMSRYRDKTGGSGLSPSHVSYDDPFKSYGGYEEFSKTGGYSPNDIANMRSRGTAPVRAAYANANREVSRGRSLQGGYSPNAAAVQAKMAREQGQSGADAMQNVEAGLAEARNKGRLSGLSGMSGIEGQRLNAQLESGMFNANANMGTDRFNAQDRNQALQGMASLYGTTPGMANMFGNQLNTSIGQGGQIGISQQNADYNAQGLPGAFDERMNQIGRGMDLFNRGSDIAGPFLKDERQGQLPRNQPYTSYNGGGVQGMPYSGLEPTWGGGGSWGGGWGNNSWGNQSTGYDDQNYEPEVSGVQGMPYNGLEPGPAANSYSGMYNNQRNRRY